MSCCCNDDDKKDAIPAGTMNELGLWAEELHALTFSMTEKNRSREMYLVIEDGHVRVWHCDEWSPGYFEQDEDSWMFVPDYKEKDPT